MSEHSGSGKGPLRERGEARSPGVLDAGMEPRPAGYQAHMIGFIVAGLIIGVLARLLMPGRQKIGLLWTLVLGVAGSVIGGTIANVLGTGSIWELNVLGFIVAVLSALGLLVVAERAGLGEAPDRKRLGRA